MKSLDERKKQRAEQRAENLKDSPFRDTGIIVEGDGSDQSEFDGMTVDELKKASVDRFETEVPKDKTLKADILEFVKNLAAYKAQDGGEDSGKGGGTSTAWKSGN